MIDPRYYYKSGPCYSNVSFIKRALFESAAKQLPLEEIHGYLVRYWRQKTSAELRELIERALFAKKSYFEMDAETGLWMVCKSVDASLNVVVDFLSKQMHIQKLSAIAKHLKARDLREVLERLQADIRFVQLDNDFWMLSEWELVNDVVYEYMRENGYEEVTRFEVLDCLIATKNIREENSIFAPEIDSRFDIYHDQIMIQIENTEKAEDRLLSINVPPDLHEEVARASILIFKLLKSSVSLAVEDIILYIFGVGKYQPTFQLYKIAVENLLHSTGDFSVMQDGKWGISVALLAEDNGNWEPWKYAVYNSRPDIAKMASIETIEAFETPLDAEKATTVSKALSLNASNSFVHYVTYYERIKGYFPLPHQWSEAHSFVGRTFGTVKVINGNRSWVWHWRHASKRGYMFGDGLADFYYDCEVAVGQKIRLMYVGDFLNVEIGEVDLTTASEQARYMDVGRLVEESRAVNKSFFTLMSEILATFPSGIHWTRLFNEVNAIRSATRSTIQNLLSQNDCFESIPKKSGYWRLNVQKLSRKYVDDYGRRQEGRIKDDFSPSPANEKMDKSSLVPYREMPALKDMFSVWAERQKSRRYSSVVVTVKEKRDRLTAITHAYAKLLCRMAERRSTGTIEFMDLVQEGFFGIKAALDSYDGKHSFAQHISTHIWSMMMAYIRDNRLLVRLPAYVYEQLASTENQRLIDMQTEMREIPISNDKEKQLLHLHRNTDYVSFEQYWIRTSCMNDAPESLLRPWSVLPHLDDRSLSAIRFEATNEELYRELDILCDVEEQASDMLQSEFRLEEFVFKRMVLSQVRQFLEAMNPRHRLVMELRYGLGDGIYRTLEEVATEIGITREGVRQIEAKVIKSLREKISILKN